MTRFRTRIEPITSRARQVMPHTRVGRTLTLYDDNKDYNTHKSKAEPEKMSDKRTLSSIGNNAFDIQRYLEV